MYDLRTIFRPAYLRAVGGAFALALYSFQVNAAGAPVVAAENAFVWLTSTTVGAGTEAVGHSTTGSKIRDLTAANVHVDSGGVKATRTGQLVLKNGVYLPVTATSKVSPTAIKGLMRKALPIAMVGAAGPLAGIMTELAIEFGMQLIENGDSRRLVKLRNSLDCIPEQPCYEFRVAHIGHPYYTAAEWPSAFPAWQLAVDGHQYIENANCTISGNQPGAIGTCQRVWGNTDNGHTIGASAGAPMQYSLIYREKPPVTSVSLVPVSVEQFADEVEKKLDYTDASVMPRAIVEAQRITGDQIKPDLPKLTGPASVTGPETKTSKPIPNGTRESTTQTKYDCKYNDPSYDGTIPGTVVCTDTTTTTEKDKVTDLTTGETTETTKQTEQVTKPADTTAEKPLETKDPCEANPDRAGCALLDTPEGEIPKSSKTVEFSAVDLGFGGGSCPANVTQDLNGQQVTIVNWVQSCDYIVQYVKPLMLTLATFAAMVIIFLGGKTE